MATGDLLSHFDKHGAFDVSYRTATANGMRVEPNAILIEPERILIAADRRVCVLATETNRALIRPGGVDKFLGSYCGEERCLEIFSGIN